MKHHRPSLFARSLLIVVAIMLAGMPVWNRPGCCVLDKLQIAASSLAHEGAVLASSASSSAPIESQQEQSDLSDFPNCPCCCQHGELPASKDSDSQPHDQPEPQRRGGKCPQIGLLSGVITVDAAPLVLDLPAERDPFLPDAALNRLLLQIMIADPDALAASEDPPPLIAPPSNTPASRGQPLPLRI